MTELHDTRLDREESDARRIASKRAPEDVGAAASVAARYVGEPSGAGARAARDRLSGAGGPAQALRGLAASSVAASRSG